MNSAHSDERNLAHCAATAMSHPQRSHPQQTANNELTKLKEEHERQTKTLKLEHKIQLLEMDNKLSKQENDNKTKILELQKEVQSLKHENEIMKLKGTHELQINKMEVDSNSEKQMAAIELEFKDRLKEKDKEMVEKIAEKDKEMTLKMAEKDKELALKMAEKDGELLKKENEHKIETVKMKNKMEKTIESLRNEVQMLKTNVKDEREKPNDQAVGINNDAVVKKEEIADPLKLPLMERLEWGVNHYIYKTKLHGIPLLKTSYQEWYENLANAMVNEKLYMNERFLFMRQVFGNCKIYLRFINFDIDDRCPHFSNTFEVKGLDTQLLKKGEFILLHPKDSLKSSRINVKQRQAYDSVLNDYKYWEFKDVPEELFFGQSKIAIVCWVLKDN
eukprot:TCONS_00003846-protein